MPKLNLSRLFLGGLVAAVICFLTDGFLHETILKADWAAVYAGLDAKLPEAHGSSMVYFAFFELGRGIIALLLYALMRPFCSPGPKTAAIAGMVSWLAFSLTGPAQFIPLKLFSNSLWIKMAAFQLVTSIIATIAGAALYKDAKQ